MSARASTSIPALRRLSDLTNARRLAGEKLVNLATLRMKNESFHAALYADASTLALARFGSAAVVALTPLASARASTSRSVSGFCLARAAS